MQLTHTGTVELRTPRLLLRPFKRTDGEAMFRNFASDPRTLEYMRWTPHTAVEDSIMLAIHWSARTTERTRYHWCIAIPETDEAIGFAGADEISDADLACNLHYCIGRKFWGHGLATEAAGAIVKHMFERVGMNRIAAYHAVENAASGRVMEKLGMVCEGTARQRYIVNGRKFDARVFAITRDIYDYERSGR